MGDKELAGVHHYKLSHDHTGTYLQIFRSGMTKMLKSLLLLQDQIPQIAEADAWIETRGGDVVCCIPLAKETIAGWVIGVNHKVIKVHTQENQVGSFPALWGPGVSQIRINDQVRVNALKQQLFIIPCDPIPQQLQASDHQPALSDPNPPPNPSDESAYSGQMDLQCLDLSRANSQPVTPSASTSSQTLSDSAPELHPSSSTLLITDGMREAFHLPSEEKDNGRTQEMPKTIGRHRLPIESLQSEFKWNSLMVQKFRELSQPYSAWRRSRGDGNCFYRCLGVLLLEHYCRLSTPIMNFHAVALRMMNQEGHFTIDVSHTGLQHFKLFITMVKELFTARTRGEEAFQTLQYVLQRSSYDAAMIVAMRHYTATYLQQHSQDPDLVPFIDCFDELIADIREYGKEAEGMALIATARCFDVVLHILTIDNKSSNITETVYGPVVPGCYPSFSVLHLPGHYNYLVRREVDKADNYDFLNNTYKSVYTGDHSLGFEQYSQ